MTTPLGTRQTGFRLPMGEWFNDIINRVNAIVAGTVAVTIGGTTPAAATVTALSVTSTETATPQILSAAGATQGAATAITKSTAIITVSTASARGVKLPTAATGLLVRLLSLCTQGTKVYPFSGDRIGSAATNTAVVIAGFKGNLYVAKNASQWSLIKGS